MLAESILALAITVSTSSSSVTQVSASASGGSSAEASTHVTTKGGSTKIDVVTEVDGVKREEHYESVGAETNVIVVATSSATTSQAAVPRTEVVKRVLGLVRSILAFFGLSIRDL